MPDTFAPKKAGQVSEEEDFLFEDMEPPKKKVNSGRKGKSGERGLVKILNARFPGGEPFSRVMGGGSHGARSLTKQAKEVLTSDIVCPPGFLFSIECKYGYEDIDLFRSFDKGNKALDKFLAQAEGDAERVGRMPLLCWKKPRSPWLAFTKEAIESTYLLRYREWHAVTLDNLLAKPDSFFFGET